MKKLTVCRSAIATTEESETFAVRRVKTRPSVTSSRTIESRPFKSTSRLARNGGGVVRRRITGMRILVIRLLVQRVPAFSSHFNILVSSLHNVQQSLDPIGL